jgi:hypothetical protein
MMNSCLQYIRVLYLRTGYLFIRLFFCYTIGSTTDAEHAMLEVPIAIIAYSGHRGEESPRAFVFNGKCIEVSKVIAQWVEENAVSKRRFRCFRVKGDDLGNHLLRYDEATGEWLYAGGTTDD